MSVLRDCGGKAMKSRVPTGYARAGLRARSEPTIEQIRRNYTTTVSQMRCPYHQQDAWVEIESDEFNTFQIEIVTCCEEFERRVRQSLMDTPSNQRRLKA